MLPIEKILLPIEFPTASTSVIHEAAILARRFGSEIVILHVLTGSDKTIDESDQPLGPEFDAIPIRRMVRRGEPAWAALQVAEEEKADLIMMEPHSTTFERFLLGSTTARVLRGSGCPVWTGAYLEQLSAAAFDVRNVLCAVDLGPRSEVALSWAVPLAAEFGARLTLAHVTSRVEFWGPGGLYINEEWKKALYDDATERIHRLQQSAGIHADVFIGSGDVPKVLAEAVGKTHADLLVTACNPYGGHLRTTHGFGIICSVPVPVMSVMKVRATIRT
jgi:nucleotide-binding universal stress UspA family protein